MAQIKPESSFTSSLVSVEGTRWNICATLKEWRGLKDLERAGTPLLEEAGMRTKGCINISALNFGCSPD